MDESKLYFFQTQNNNDFYSYIDLNEYSELEYLDESSTTFYLKSTNSEKNKCLPIKLKAKTKEETHDWVKKINLRNREYSPTNSMSTNKELDSDNNLIMLAEFMMAEEQKSIFADNINDQIKLSSFESMLDNR